MGVSYDKKMRERAAAEGKGLVTLQIIEPGAKPGKFGASVTMQGPADAVDVKSFWTFFLTTTRRRTRRARKHPAERA